MRTFFACTPPPQAIIAIDEWRAINWPLLKWPVAPENFHITLVFTGEINQLQLQRLHESILEVDHSAFEMNFDSTGFFGKADILWLGMRNPPEALMQLVISLQAICRRCGIALDKRSYVPHISLARHCGELPTVPLIEPGIGFVVDSFQLMCSENRKGSLRYRTLFCHRLMR